MKTIQELAQELRDTLAPGCEHIEVAGSIRRGKAAPKDIELVVVPLLRAISVFNIFGEAIGDRVENRLDTELDALYLGGAWTLDPDLPRNGPRYKRLRHVESGVCCDLFITTAVSWGVIFTIRTGPGDFSKALVTRALRRGMKVDEGRLWKVHRDGTRDAIPTPDEAAFFAALGLPYLEPEERSIHALTNGRTP